MKSNKISLAGISLTAALAVFLTLQMSAFAQPPAGGPPPGGPGAGQAPPPGPGGPGMSRGQGRPGMGRGPGGQGRGFGAPPRPGQVLPEMLQNRLKLTDDQKIELAKLQKDVDLKLAKILTADQNKQLKTMQDRGPGRPGGPGGGPGRAPGGGPGGPRRGGQPGAGGPGPGGSGGSPGN